MSENTKTAKVININSPKSQQLASEKKWGKAVIGLGFSIIPSLIFKAQARLGLNHAQLAILLHLADFWWQKERMPFPSKAELAERMNVTTRQIQRYMAELETAGYIQRVERFASHKGQQNNEYDLSGLVKRLKDLEPEFTDVKKEAKRVSKGVSKRGGLVVHDKKDNDK